jgi:hypothetical protein
MDHLEFVEQTVPLRAASEIFRAENQWRNFWAGDPIFRSKVRAGDGELLSEPFRHPAHSMHGQGSQNEIFARVI